MTIFSAETEKKAHTKMKEKDKSYYVVFKKYTGETDHLKVS